MSLLPVLGNIYSGILGDRTRDWVLYCQGLTAIQAVSIAARRREGNVSLVEKGVDKQRLNILVLCRSEKEFDNVEREGMWFRMKKIGVRTW